MFVEGVFQSPTHFVWFVLLRQRDLEADQTLHPLHHAGRELGGTEKRGGLDPGERASALFRQRDGTTAVRERAGRGGTAFTLGNFAHVLRDERIVQAFVNSALISTLATLLSLMVTVTSGYMLSRFRGALDLVQDRRCDRGLRRRGASLR